VRCFDYVWLVRVDRRYAF